MSDEEYAEMKRKIENGDIQFDREDAIRFGRDQGQVLCKGDELRFDRCHLLLRWKQRKDKGPFRSILILDNLNV